MNKVYKVESYYDDNYIVMLLDPEKDRWDMTESELIDAEQYKGSLADCEAYIRLHEGGYM